MTVWARWSTFWAQREAGTSLALTRIAVGGVVASDLAWNQLSGATALMWGEVGDTPEGFRHFTEGGLFGALGGAHYGTVVAVLWGTVAAATLLAVGIFPRFAAFVALQGCIALFHLNLMTQGGHDRVITNALWLLVLADSGRTLSLGCRLRTGRWVDTTEVLAWPRRLVVAQLAVMYTATGLQKVAPEWWPHGDFLAIYHMLLSPIWSRYDLSPGLGWAAPLTQVLAPATVLWESTFWLAPLAVHRGWRMDVRRIYVTIGVLFHVGLALVANLGPFSAITLALYPCLYGPGEWGRWFGRER